ncbi:hypothetical protein FACS1894217_01960 [Clostridia bacterium]|nr:hypothetical protein FACS1894217_01960 [Clostridia bacterium]
MYALPFLYSRTQTEDYKWISLPKNLARHEASNLLCLFEKYKGTDVSVSNIFVKLNRNHYLSICKFINTQNKDAFGRTIYAICGYEIPVISGEASIEDIITFFYFSDEIFRYSQQTELRLDLQRINLISHQNTKAETLTLQLKNAIRAEVWLRVSVDRVVLETNQIPLPQEKTKSKPKQKAGLLRKFISWLFGNRHA